MRKSIRNSLPRARTALGIIVVCLVLGVLIGGLHPGALYGLVVAAMILLILFLANYDPDAYQAHYYPREYILTKERNELCNLLVALTAAIKSKDDAAVEARAKKASEYLDSFSPGLRTR